MCSQSQDFQQFVRVRWLVWCFLSWFVVGSNACYAQNRTPITFDQAISGVVKIKTNSGRGTGFVVAADNATRKVEIWTNAHVAGLPKRTVSITWFQGTFLEQKTTGTVARSRQSTGTTTVDMAKIIAEGPSHRPFAFKPRNDWRSFSSNSHTAGFPKGEWISAATIRIIAAKNEIGEFKPIAIPGQSGSPVFNSFGEVLGVITFRTSQGTGLFLPINQWTERINVVSKKQVTFEQIPLAK